MPEHDDLPEILTAEEAARLLRLSTVYVRAAAADGRIPAQRVGGRWRFSRSRLLAWIAEGQQPR